MYIYHTHSVCALSVLTCIVVVAWTLMFYWFVTDFEVVRVVS